MKKSSPYTIVVALIAFLTVTAQVENAGTFNNWTTRSFSRAHPSAAEPPHLKVVRAAKQNGFDRVVFEFDGPLPNYHLEYLRSRYYEATAGRERIRQAGRAFLQINFFVIRADEDQIKFSDAKDFVPKGDLKLPSLRSVKDKELFEGYYDFLIGVNSRKLYRVNELSNPSRLVVDFKH